MTEISYKVKSGQFEGPLEVLLGLIEKRKLFINEISLAEITDDYIRYVQNLENKKIEHYANFIAVAATLILVKSRSLLPNLTLTSEEETQIDDLEARLRLYKVIQDVGQEIQKKYGKQIIFPKLSKKNEMRVFSPDKQITKELMSELSSSVISAIPEPRKEKLKEVEVFRVKSLKEMIDDLTERVMKSFEKTNFNDLWKGQSFVSKKEERVTVIVSFLAVLELVRSGIMEAFQDDDGEINIEKQEKREDLPDIPEEETLNI
ncbi:MAG: segregation and condensation protein [Patescibacteria group bacterium]|nr:segregation and condensation protein [Patescibacteria group bacterium]